MIAVGTYRDAVQPRPALQNPQFASLIGSYEDVSSPIWVYDVEDRCVYRNLIAASRTEPSDDGALVFELTDHRERLIGRLVTVST